MDERLRAGVARALGSEPKEWRPAGAGYTHNERWVAKLANGRSVFVKAAVDDLTAEWLRAEHRVYAGVEAGFLPQLLGWADDGLPILVLEDLSAAAWPPPWTVERVDAVLATLREVAGTPPPDDVEPLERQRAELAGWIEVARDPAPFLGLGLVSPEWLECALPALCEAEATCPLAGDALLHFDVRSDNICFRAGRALLVDWNWAVRGNHVLDVAAWLPSLAAEGGPRPEEILTGEPGPQPSSPATSRPAPAFRRSRSPRVFGRCSSSRFAQDFPGSCSSSGYRRRPELISRRSASG